MDFSACIRWLRNYLIFFGAAFAVTSTIYILMSAPCRGEGYIFGALFRMFVYHYQYPFQYISLVCLFYALAAPLLAPLVARWTSAGWAVSLLVVILSPLLASPLGGMLWHYHDMLAGRFPSYAVDKLTSGAMEGIELGWLIMLLSFPYNVACTVLGVFGTTWLSRKLYSRSPSASGSYEVGKAMAAVLLASIALTAVLGVMGICLVKLRI